MPCSGLLSCPGLTSLQNSYPNVYPSPSPLEPSHIARRLCGTHWFGEYMNGWKDHIWKSSPKWHRVYDTECDYKIEKGTKHLYTVMPYIWHRKKVKKRLKFHRKQLKRLSRNVMVSSAGKFRGMKLSPDFSQK